MSLRGHVPERLPGIVVFLTIGLGVGGGYLGFDTGIVWVLGFAVLLPLAGMLSPDGDERDGGGGTDGTVGTVGAAEPTDPLDRLRDRYARGELSEEAFERKLELLLETETPEDARHRIGRADRTDRTERERAAEFE